MLVIAERLNDGVVCKGMRISAPMLFSGWIVIFWPREVKFVHMCLLYRQFVSSVRTCDICVRMDLRS
jgi:hypothetical protein